MTTIVIDIPKEIYLRIAREAQQRQLPIDTLIRTWLTERSESSLQSSDRWHIRATLHAAGLLVEQPERAHHKLSLNPEERSRVAQQIPPGKAMSVLILEEREGIR